MSRESSRAREKIIIMEIALEITLNFIFFRVSFERSMEQKKQEITSY